MAQIFDNLHHRGEKERRFCQSPVDVSRSGRLEAWVRFSNRWLDERPYSFMARHELLEIIRSVEHPGEFAISAMWGPVSVVIFIYSIELDKASEETLNEIVQRVIHATIAYFGAAPSVPKMERVPLADLVLPQHLEDYLRNYGIKYADEITEWTREEICQLPKVKTEDVRTLELHLARFGLFLAESPLPPYKE